MVRWLGILVLALSLTACGDNEIVTASRPPSANPPSGSSGQEEAPAVTISGAPKSLIRDGETFRFVPTVENADPLHLEFEITYNDVPLNSSLDRPDWLKFDRATGELIGTPDETQTGEYGSFKIHVRDQSTGKIANTDPFSIRVGKPYTAGKPLKYLQETPTDKSLVDLRVTDAASVLIDSSINILGGKQNGVPSNATWKYMPDTANPELTPNRSMNISRYDFAASAVDGRIYAFGGFRSDLNNDVALNSIEKYINSGWSLLPLQLSQSRAGLASCSDGDKIYLTGGGIDSRSYATVDIFSPSTETISSAPSLNYPRKNHQCFILNKVLYVVGGFGTTDDLPMETLALDDPIAVWQVLETPAPTREKATVQVLNDKAYLFGGFTVTDRAIYEDTVEIFDPATVEWTPTFEKMPVPLARGLSAALAGKIWILGGKTLASDSAAVYVYDPTFDYDPANPPPQ